MAKAQLVFDLPAEDYEYLCAFKAVKTQAALRDLESELRSFIKHDTPLGGCKKPTTRDVVDYVRASLAEIFVG